jgi:hypothetical protein
MIGQIGRATWKPHISKEATSRQQICHYGQLVAEESRTSNPKTITNFLKVEGDIGKILASL